MRLPAALAVSSLLHALIVAGGHWRLSPPKTATEPPLQATLAAPRPAPQLIVPEPAEQTATPPEKPAQRLAAPARTRARSVAAAANDPVAVATRQIARALLYPPEAIARGIEGEAVVMLFLDEAGNAIAARLERSSGHAILDDAAVRAARQVRALPEGAPSEVVLPVRFRLR